MKKKATPPPMIESVVETFDESVESYSAQIEDSFGPLADNHDFFIRHKACLIRQFLEGNCLKKNVRILDVGCGIGLIHPYIVDEFVELHGVDISAKSIEIAEQKNPSVLYSYYEGKQLPYADNEFDLVFAMCVIHHVPVTQWQFFVDEMARVARSGRYVMIFEHNPLNPGTQWVVRNCDLDNDAVLLSQWKLKKLFQISGLKKIETKNILFTPFDAPIFRRIDTLMNKVPLGAQYSITATKS